jgi:hypothetical protein
MNIAAACSLFIQKTFSNTTIPLYTRSNGTITPTSSPASTSCAFFENTQEIQIYDHQLSSIHKLINISTTVLKQPLQCIILALVYVRRLAPHIHSFNSLGYNTQAGPHTLFLMGLILASIQLTDRTWKVHSWACVASECGIVGPNIATIHKLTSIVNICDVAVPKYNSALPVDSTSNSDDIRVIIPSNNALNESQTAMAVVREMEERQLKEVEVQFRQIQYIKTVKKTALDVLRFDVFVSEEEYREVMMELRKFSI